MNELAIAISSAIATVFTYLTARVAIKRKTNDTLAVISNNAYDNLVSRVDKLEKENTELRKIQLNYSLLSSKYDALEKENEDLRHRLSVLKQRYDKLEIELRKGE